MYCAPILDQRREEIVKEIESNNRADNNFTETLITMLKLASGAGETFKGSTTEEKRKLLDLVFSNLELKGQKLVYSLRPPFDAFVKTIESLRQKTKFIIYPSSSYKFLPVFSKNLEKINLSSRDSWLIFDLPAAEFVNHFASVLMNKLLMQGDFEL